jgi:hypothetical protein
MSGPVRDLGEFDRAAELAHRIDLGPEAAYEFSQALAAAYDHAPVGMVCLQVLLKLCPGRFVAFA